MNNMVQTWLMVNGSKFAKKDMGWMTKLLGELEESKTAALMSAQVKSPLVGLLLTLFLGQLGVGRFYAGSWIRGLLCLILWGVGILGWAMTGEGAKEGSYLMMALGPAVWLLLLDCFCIWGEIARDNAKRVCLAVASPVEPSLRKRMREHILCYWVFVLVFGGASLMGMSLMRDDLATAVRREAIRANVRHNLGL